MRTKAAGMAAALLAVAVVVAVLLGGAAAAAGEQGVARTAAPTLQRLQGARGKAAPATPIPKPLPQASTDESARFEELDANRRRVGFIGKAVSKVVSVGKKVVKHVVTKVKAVAKKVVHHVKKAVAKVKEVVKTVVHHVKKHVGAVFGIGTSAAAAKEAFANPPPPPPVKAPPPFKPPPRLPPHEFDDKAKLTYQRFMCCYVRQNASPNSRTVRAALLDYREEVLKTIPGLTTALVEGVRLQLTKSPESVKKLVEMYERRARMLQGVKGEAPNDDPLVAYEASPDMLGDIMWSHWCGPSTPCTQDENCLISTLLLFNVLGGDGRNASPTVDGEQLSPAAEEYGPYIGQADDPNAPNEYYSPASSSEASAAADSTASTAPATARTA